VRTTATSTGTLRGILSASALVAAATELASAFDRGGRLLATGEGRALADAKHVAVEFLHPVIVGKRALPAAVGSDKSSADDILLGIAYGGSRLETPVDIALSDRSAPDARHEITLPTENSSAKEAALLSYHVLWELVHVFLEDEATTHAGSDSLDALYPMLSSRSRSPAESNRSTYAALASTQEKLTTSAALRAASLAANEEAITVASQLFADARTVFTFGNGGSATDASDLAWALGAKGWALSDDVATVTALANDVSFEVVFARQLATLARPGDVVVALSTSGTSANVTAALAQAQRLGLGTVGLCGYDGGDMAAAGLDACCVVDSTSVHRIQESYVAIYDEMLRRSMAATATA